MSTRNVSHILVCWSEALTVATPARIQQESMSLLPIIQSCYIAVFLQYNDFVILVEQGLVGCSLDRAGERENEDGNQPCAHPMQEWFL